MNNHKKNNLIIISLLVATSLIITLLVIKPSIDNINNIKNQIQDQRVELEKKYQQILYFQKNIQGVKKIQTELAIVDKMFLTSGEELNFINTLENIATQNDITQTINLKNIVSGEEISTYLLFSIDLKGTTPNIINYLFEIEKLPYYINFDKFELTALNKTKVISNVSISGTINQTNNIGLKLNGIIYLSEPEI